MLLTPEPKVETLSIGVASVMIILYGLSLFYSYRVVGKVAIGEKEFEEMGQKRWSLRMAILILGLSTLGVVYLSEVLVGAVEPVVKALGLSEFFIGLISFPINW